MIDAGGASGYQHVFLLSAGLALCGLVASVLLARRIAVQSHKTAASAR
jgi:hypothetical protein